jgi:hypothetical protein
MWLHRREPWWTAKDNHWWLVVRAGRSCNAERGSWWSRSQFDEHLLRGASLLSPALGNNLLAMPLE